MGLNKKVSKSPSERLRGVFYHIWSKNPEEFKDDFDGYYESKMEKIINHYSNLIK